MEVTWIIVAAVISALVFGALGYILCLVMLKKRVDGIFVIDKADNDGRAGVYLEGFFPNYEELMKRKTVVFRVENQLKQD
jgi:hypothetical protein